MQPDTITTMRELPPKRRILKWAGGLASSLLLFVYVLSPWWGLSVGLTENYNQPSNWSYSATFVGGRLELGYVIGKVRGLGIIHVSRYTGPTTWWFNRVAATNRVGATFRQVGIPIWFLLLIVGIPTALLWRSDRSYPAGHCQSCGYNLTLNTTGICPECGTETDSAAARG